MFIDENWCFQNECSVLILIVFNGVRLGDPCIRPWLVG